MASVTFLGPQQPTPTLAAAVDSLGIRGTIAAITAGWEEREPEDDELKAHLGGRSRNLKLWERTEEIFESDTELLAGLRTRKERVLRLQEMYRLRLAHEIDAVLGLFAMKGVAEIIEPEQEEAIATVRRLDQHQLDRVAEVNAEFDARYRPNERDAVVEHRGEVARRIEDAEAIAIAGGHVGVLITRLRLFGIADLIGHRRVIAWSAGTMALAGRIVLFHDSPPQGRGNAEVFEPGLGLVPGLLPFPHGRKRLKLGDPLRVQLLARRFEPEVCMPMDVGDRVDWDGRSLAFSSVTRHLHADGRVTVGAGA